jgi:tRNA/tmRNA/rRNA uracil-C5-methylase (TrmA/RlmC/RlmD family)
MSAEAANTFLHQHTYKQQKPAKHTNSQSCHTIPHQPGNQILYNKKQKLHEQLYRLQLACADKWTNIWPTILQAIDQKLTLKMDSHYNNLNRKLDKLLSKQPKRKTEHIQSYPRTVNLTNVKLTPEEISLLNKGLQYSIEKPIGKYWTDLIMKTTGNKEVRHQNASTI